MVQGAKNILGGTSTPLLPHYFPRLYGYRTFAVCHYTSYLSNLLRLL